MIGYYLLGCIILLTILEFCEFDVKKIGLMLIGKMKNLFFILKIMKDFFELLADDHNVFREEKPQPMLYSCYLDEQGKIKKNTIAFGQFFTFSRHNWDDDPKERYLALIAIKILLFLKLFYVKRVLMENGKKILMENGKKIAPNNTVVNFGGFTLLGKYVIGNGGVYMILFLFLFSIFNLIIQFT